MQSLLILGRQPEIGLSELISLYGVANVELAGEQAAIVDIDPCNFQFNRLGGSTKFCKLLSSIDSTDWKDVEKFLVDVSPEHSLNMPEGKMTLGLSLYGFDRIDPKAIMASGLKLKKAIQSTGRSVRFVPNKATELNTAQVIHNKLTSDKAWELVIVNAKAKTFIAQTIKVQDIAYYAKRDQVRPFRDSRVGMLPPKLAQIIINLAVGELSGDQLSSICDNDSKSPIPPANIDQTILDPFCGTGVVLQEALLMGYQVIGSDIEPRMIDYSTKNIDWLKSNFNVGDHTQDNIFIGDATTTNWPPVDFIASETNLGKPLSVIPPTSELNEIVSSVSKVIEKFLVNLAKQIKSGTRLCIAVPAWQIAPDQFKNLPLIDQIDNLGYTFVDFKHKSAEQLVYYRPEQIVARRLLVITRK